MATNTTHTLTFTEANFRRDVLENRQPVLVDFHALWCGPCHVMAPIIEELATEFDGQVVVGKVDVDDHPNLAAQYGIRSIPTILLFKDGQVVERAVGVVSKQELAEELHAIA